MEDFDILHVHLSEIDPNVKTVDQGLYKLQLVNAELKEFVYKNGPNTGSTGYRAAFCFVIVDDPNWSGRKIFDSVFIGQGGLKSLRRLMDGTGIAQGPGQPLGEWLSQVKVEAPVVKMMVLQEEDRDKDGNIRTYDFQGNCALINRLNWREVQPA